MSNTIRNKVFLTTIHETGTAQKGLEYQEDFFLRKDEHFALPFLYHSIN